MTTATATCLSVNRKSLVKALEQVVRVIPTSTSKPILQGVQLEATDGMLWLSATDLDTSLLVFTPASDDLPRCIVPGRDLLQRVKAGQVASCNLELQDNYLLANGGPVQHKLRTLPVAEFPPIRTRPEGQSVLIRADRLREAMETALTGVARDPSRYAIDGVLLEVNQGVRLVATDGRRLVTCELTDVAEAREDLSAILPIRFCRLMLKLIPKYCEEPVRLFVKANAQEDGEKLQSDVYAVGSEWLLHSLEVEGNFPAWRDVVPRGGSRFLLDRDELLGTLKEVALACSTTNAGVQMRLEDGQTLISGRSEENGESSGLVKTRFLGGGDSLIITGFNPGFLIEIVESLPPGQIVFELQQNKPSTGGTVSHSPVVIHGWGVNSSINWVLMPVNTGVDANRESLGSNYPAEGSQPCSSPR